MPSRRVVIWAQFRVFMVTVCALSIIGVLFYKLTGGTLLEPKVALRIYIPDATGLAKSSPVRVDGIDVGKVRSVELTGSTDPNRIVEVVMTVEAEHLRHIPVDSYAQISADTLIGDKYVDITGGKLGRYVSANSEIRYQPQTDVLKNLDLSQFEQTLKQMDALLTDIEQGRGQLGLLVQSDELYNDLSQKLVDLHRGLTKAASTTGQVGQALYTDTVYRRISDPLRQLDEALARIQSGQGAAGQLLRDSSAYDSLRSAAAGFLSSLAEIRAGRGPVGELLTTDTTYNDLNRQVALLIEAVDRTNQSPMFAGSDVYENLNGTAQEWRRAVHELRADPEKFLRFKVF